MVLSEDESLYISASTIQLIEIDDARKQIHFQLFYRKHFLSGASLL